MEIRIYEDYRDMYPELKGRELTERLLYHALAEAGMPDLKIMRTEKGKPYVKEMYDHVTGEFDKVLAKHGYEREGHYYKVNEENNDTIIFFCHFGLECVLLSHLLNVSPMVLWHGCVAAPSSVTTLTTEERRQGIAAFRMSAFGDISHLYANNEPPAFAARFCEAYGNKDQRHD